MSETDTFTACTLIAILAVSIGCGRGSTSISPTSADSEAAAASNEDTEPLNSNGGTDVVQNDARDVEIVQASGMDHGIRRQRRGFGRGRGGMQGMRPDMSTIHAMFAARDKIRRTVSNLPDGAEAITESDDDNITTLIQEHVPAMEGRVLGNEPLPPMTFHPIFVELLKSSEKYELEYEETVKGIKVTYAADDPNTVMLVQEHAGLVSRFLKNGMSEIHKPYTLPDVESRAAERELAREKAITAKEALFKRLSGRLAEVVKQKGPVEAIEVCSREASAIAESISEEHGLAIGRTALKLRNPQNAPPEWVEPLVQEPAIEARFVDLPGGHKGALLPIKLHAKCLTCHGQDEIPTEVRTKLSELYPDDAATGFREGDLRGWFWVDVPPSRSVQERTENQS